MVTPVRQFQVLAMAVLALTSWMGISIRAFRSALPGGGLEETLADLTAGDGGERWFSFYVAILAWGHIPVMFLLVAWGTVLAVHSIVLSWREQRADGPPVGPSAGPDPYVPAPLMFWGATVLGVLTLSAAGLAPMTSPALYWDDYYGIAQWAAVLWWLLALATVVAAIVRALQPRRDRVRRRPPGGQLPFEQAAVLQRSGDGDLLTDEERERMGAGGSGWTVLTFFLGIIGLGPVGLFTGRAAMEGHRTSSWLATIGILLSAVQTTILLVAAVLAMSTA